MVNGINQEVFSIMKNELTVNQFYDFAILNHNGNIVKEAESMLKSFVENNSDRQKSYLYLVNPNGEPIKIQPGFKLLSYEIIAD